MIRVDVGEAHAKGYSKARQSLQVMSGKSICRMISSIVEMEMPIVSLLSTVLHLAEQRC
jgi:hypothetical protein